MSACSKRWRKRDGVDGRDDNDLLGDHRPRQQVDPGRQKNDQAESRQLEESESSHIASPAVMGGRSAATTFPHHPPRH
jgi:hypothetical protein